MKAPNGLPNGEQGAAVTHRFWRTVHDSIDPNTGLRQSARGKRVCVTGAGAGIGRAMALAFAQAGAAACVLVDLNAEGLRGTAELLEAQKHCAASTLALDIAAPDACAQLSLALGEGVDVLCANAGIYSPGRTGECSPTHWWRTWEVHLLGTYQTLHSALPLMLKRGGGTVILTSSIQGVVPARQNESAYACSKAALARLAEHLDLEHRAAGIRAFALHPGGVATELALQTAAADHHLLLDPPELAAGMCVYLSTTKADFLRGRWVRSNWDLEELEARAADIEAEDLFKLRLAL